MALIGSDSNALDLSTTQNIDQSQSYSEADQSTGSQTGARITAGTAAGATFNISDPVAVQMAKEVALSGTGLAGQVVSSLAGASKAAMEESFALAKQIKETGSQTLGKYVTWAIGLVVAGVVIYFWTRGKKAPHGV